MNDEPPSPRALMRTTLPQLKLSGSTSPRKRAAATESRKLVPPVLFVVFALTLCTVLCVHLLLRLH